MISERIDGIRYSHSTLEGTEIHISLVSQMFSKGFLKERKGYVEVYMEYLLRNFSVGRTFSLENFPIVIQLIKSFSHYMFYDI